MSKSRQRLLPVAKLFLWITTSVVLIAIGLQEHVNVFVTVRHLKEHALELENKRLRLGGVVVRKSITNKADLIEFRVKNLEGIDDGETIKVSFKGIPPALFKEDKVMVADGQMKNGVFMAREILAKHDENYQIPKQKMIGR